MREQVGKEPYVLEGLRVCIEVESVTIFGVHLVRKRIVRERAELERSACYQ